MAVGIGQNVFSSVLLRGLRESPEFENVASIVLDVGATELRNLVPDTLVSKLLDVYSKAITATFLLPIVAAGLAFFLSLGLERRKLDISKSL